MTRDDEARHAATTGKRRAKPKRTTTVGRTGARFPSAAVLEESADADRPNPATSHPGADRERPADTGPALADRRPPTPDWPPVPDGPAPEHGATPAQDAAAPTEEDRPSGARFGPYSARNDKHADDSDTASTPDQRPPTPPGEPTPEQSAERTVQMVMPWSGALVRPYAHTGGRTRSSHDLALEALVSTSGQSVGAGLDEALTTHHRRMIVDMCLRPRSVAEIAALLSVPLGVARVLLGDLATAGVVIVHPTASSTGDGAPDVEFMRRVLVGLRRL